MKTCHVCGDATNLCCSDCAINFGASVYVCSKSSCRDEHEIKCWGDKPVPVDTPAGVGRDPRAGLGLANEFEKLVKHYRDPVPGVDVRSISPGWQTSGVDLSKFADLHANAIFTALRAAPPTPPADEVEAVAKAIWESEYDDDAYPWNKQDRIDRGLAITQANAAIRALDAYRATK